MSSATVLASSPAGVSSAISRPSRISSSRSQREASSITWLETSTAAPASARRWKVSHSSTRSTGSRPTVGSSSTSSAGSPSRATASETRERWPPESRLTIRSRSLARATGLDALARPGRADAEDPGEEAEVLGDGEVVVHAGLLGDVADPVAQRRVPAGEPSTSTAPLVIRCTPTIERISVVLPQPDGPSRPVTCPDLTTKSRSRRTSLPPRVTLRPRTATALFIMC